MLLPLLMMRPTAESAFKQRSAHGAGILNPRPRLEQVRAVLAEKSRAGHTAAIRELLQKYGAAKLSLVDPQYYEALLRDAEGLADAT